MPPGCQLDKHAATFACDQLSRQPLLPHSLSFGAVYISVGVAPLFCCVASCCVFLYAGSGGQACDVCPAGTFSEQDGTRNDCDKCDPGQTSPQGAPSKDYCFCATGQSGACTACPVGTWSENGVCRQCAEGKTSDIGATSPSDCCEYESLNAHASGPQPMLPLCMQHCSMHTVLAAC